MDVKGLSSFVNRIKISSDNTGSDVLLFSLLDLNTQEKISNSLRAGKLYNCSIFKNTTIMYILKNPLNSTPSLWSALGRQWFSTLQCHIGQLIMCLHLTSKEFRVASITNIKKTSRHFKILLTWFALQMWN